MSIPFNTLDSLMNAANNQSLSQAAYGGLLGGGPSTATASNYPTYPTVYVPLEPTGRITIVIDEVSNGHIIKIGSLTRVVTYQEDLVENIGAALTHAKMENKDAK